MSLTTQKQVIYKRSWQWIYHF